MSILKKKIPTVADALSGLTKIAQDLDNARIAAEDGIAAQDEVIQEARAVRKAYQDEADQAVTVSANIQKLLGVSE